MKRGFTTLEFVIASILLLLAAGASIFIFSERLPRGFGIVEGLLPEKCATTGLTQDQYLQQITAALTGSKPNPDQARALFLEMKTCFPQADIPNDLKVFAMTATKPKIAPLAAAATNKAFKEILRVYQESRAMVPLEAWDAAELLAFARALYWYGKTGSSRDDELQQVRAIVNIALAKPKSPLQETELRYLEAVSAGSDDRTGLLEALAKRIEKDPSPESKLYLGLALDFAGGNVIPYFEAARASSDVFAKDAANFMLGVKYSVADDGKNAALAYEEVMKHADSVFMHSSAYQYRSLPVDNRAYLDCAGLIQQGFITQEPCVCEIGRDVFEMLPFGKCLCWVSRRCEDYQSNELCDADPCGFARCRWIVSSTTQGAVGVCGSMR